MRITCIASAIALSIVLSGCSTSQESATDPLSGLYKVTTLTNSVKATNFYINGQQIPLETCDRHRCITRGGFLTTLTAPGVTLAQHDFVTEAKISGVDIVRTDRNDDWRLLGGWMVHSAFFVHKLISLVDSNTFLVYPQSLGRIYRNDSAALPVVGSASYEGAMVGTNIMTADRYTGQSSMIANFGEAPTIDINFTNIMNLSTGDSHSDISYDDISIGERKSIWGHNSIGGYVNGEFMGPDNEEVVGVFEEGELIGAFGAKRAE